MLGFVSNVLTGVIMTTRKTILKLLYDKQIVLWIAQCLGTVAKEDISESNHFTNMYIEQKDYAAIIGTEKWNLEGKQKERLSDTFFQLYNELVEEEKKHEN